MRADLDVAMESAPFDLHSTQKHVPRQLPVSLSLLSSKMNDVPRLPRGLHLNFFQLLLLAITTARMTALNQHATIETLSDPTLKPIKPCSQALNIAHSR